MKVDIETPQGWSRRLTITVPADRVQQERSRVATLFAKRVRLPGFRKGKVPASVVEKQYGASIDQQTVERLIESAYREALQQERIAPISRAAVDDVSYEPGRELSFKVEFEVRPEIELERLGGFSVQRPAAAVEEADVDRVVERLREENASWTPLEAGSPSEGDRVRVEITPLQSEGGETPEPREYQVVLGADEILDSIDRQIRALEVGTEAEVTVEVPAEAAGAGDEDHRIRLKLLSAERPALPAVDDEFARSLGDFESVDALRARIREDLAAEAEREADRAVRSQLMERILEANPFEVPPSLTDQYLDGLLQAPEDADPEELARAKQQAQPMAERAVRRMLVIDRVAQMENLSATEADVDARVAEIAESNGMEPAQVRRQLLQSGRLDALASDITERRVFDYLKSLSTIEEEAD